MVNNILTMTENVELKYRTMVQLNKITTISKIVTNTKKYIL